MAEEIGSLEIQIQAQATKANNAIDKLVTKLDRLSTSLGSINSSSLVGLSNGVNKLSTSMQGLNGVKTADFTRLANNITKLGNINVSALNSAASSMSHLTRAFNSLGTISQNAQSVGQMASNLSKLGNKGVQNAIVNMPQLATAMNQLMTTLSKSPKVSQNVIQMTNALANLANQGRSVGAATNTLTSGLNRSNSAMQKSAKSAFSLAAAFGKFYASYFLVIRGIKKLWSSIEGTADYIEAYNYYNVAFGKIASEWDKNWEKYGYENAENYASSFTKRMNQTLSKMSGIQIDIESGLLSETGLKNLGLNIKEITQYAAQLASVTNSVGQTGEVSLAAASSFTKLAGDISSLFNIDFSTAMTNLQSGLIGQSRALYKYGIDITNATLQTYAYDLGLEKAVSEMTQAEKMQLRMIAILKQSKVSWGDLANTINSPSNMIRQFTNNLKETGMVLGQLFIPLLQKVLPIINGVTIAIKRLFVNIAGFLGVKVDLDSFGQGYADLGDSLDDVTGAYNDATGAAKKFKTITLGIDELNINAPQDESGSGAVGGGSIDLTDEILKATEEYEKIWNEAFTNMESKAQEFADMFSDILEPVKKLFKDISIGDWFSVGGDVSDIAIGIFDFLSDALKKVKWKKIGENIGSFLSGIKWKDVLMSAGNFIETLVDSAIDLWKGSFETAPIETTLITALAIAKFTGLDAIIASKLAAAFPTTLSVGKTITVVGITLVVGFEVGKELGKLLFPEDAEWYDNFTWFGDDGFFKTIKKDFGSALDGLVLMATDFKNNPVIASLTNVLAGPIGAAALQIAGHKDEIKKLLDSIAPWFTKDKWSELLENVKIAFSEKWDEIKEWWANSTLVTLWEDDIAPWFTIEKWSELLENINSAFVIKWEELKTWWQESALYLWWEEDVKPWFTTDNWSVLWDNVKSAFSTKWGEIKTWWNSTAIGKWWKEDVEPWFAKKKWEEAMKGVKEAFSTTWESAISSIKGIWNKFATWLNEKLVWTIEPVVIMGVTVFEGATINLGRIPTFETGGFPEDGLFWANHNELVGQFSNGHTAVANNEMIVAGIEEAAYRGFARAYAENSREADLLVELIEAVREGKTVSIDGRELVSAVDEREARNGFKFA